eukprot:4134085-Pyramimonas_sp.AAC.1
MGGVDFPPARGRCPLRTSAPSTPPHPTPPPPRRTLVVAPSARPGAGAGVVRSSEDAEEGLSTDYRLRVREFQELGSVCRSGGGGGVRLQVDRWEGALVYIGAV